MTYELAGYKAESRTALKSKLSQAVDRLHEPVRTCVRCGYSFIRKHYGAPSIYCGRSCANRSSTEMYRKRLQAQKVERALLAYRQFASLHSKPVDWKQWICEEAEVNQRWLTRAIGNGRLPGRA